MTSLLLLMAVLSAGAEDRRPPPPGHAAEVADMAGQARARFKKHPDSCAGVFSPDRIREFLLYATAEKKGFNEAAARAQELAIEEAACRAAAFGDDGPCDAMALWEGEKAGGKSRLSSACRGRRAEARFLRAVHFDRKGEAEACAGFFAAAEWNPLRTDAVAAACAEAVPAERDFDARRCGKLGRKEWMKGARRGEREALVASCEGRMRAAHSGSAADCAKDDKGRPEAGCVRFMAFSSSFLGRGACKSWDCAARLDPAACGGPAAAMAEDFCKALPAFTGERADEALFRVVYQR